MQCQVCSLLILHLHPHIHNHSLDKPHLTLYPISELGMVTAGGKVIWGRYAQITVRPHPLLPKTQQRSHANLDHSHQEQLRNGRLRQRGTSCLNSNIPGNQMNHDDYLAQDPLAVPSRTRGTVYVHYLSQQAIKARTEAKPGIVSDTTFSFSLYRDIS